MEIAPRCTTEYLCSKTKNKCVIYVIGFGGQQTILLATYPTNSFYSSGILHIIPTNTTIAPPVFSSVTMTMFGKGSGTDS